MTNTLLVKTLDKSKMPPKPAPFLFCIISIVAYLAFLSFFEQGFPAMDPVYTQPFSDSEFFLTFSLVMILGIQVFVLGYRHFQIKPNWVIATICILLFVSDVIAILSFPSSYEVTSTYSYYLSDINRVRYIFSWFAACIGFYMIFAVIPKMAINSRQWDFLFKIGISLGLFSVFYSYIAEFGIYNYIFDATISIDLSTAPVSFTNNRNTYATILLLGIISSAYLYIRNHHWWYFLFSLFFYLNEFLVLSKTTIIVSTIFYLGYLIWLYVITVRKHFIRSNIILTIFICFFLTVVIVHNTAESWPLATFQKLINAVLDAIQNKGLDSVESRVLLWNIQLSAIYSDPAYIVFGFGDHNYEPLLGALFNQSTELGYAHMGILDVFGRLGVVGLIAYFAAIVYFIILLANVFSKKRRITYVYLLMMLAFLIHGAMESTNFLSLEPTSLAFLLAVFLPLITDETNDKRPEMFNYYLGLYSGKTYPTKKNKWTPLSIYQLSLFALTPLVSILIGVGPIVTRVVGGCSFDNTSSVVTFAIIWVLTPIVLTSSFSLVGHKRPYGIVLFTLSIVSSVVLFALGLMVDNVAIPIGTSLVLGLILALSLIRRKDHAKLQIKQCATSFLAMLIISLVVIGFEEYVSNVVRPANTTRYILPTVIIISLSVFALITFGFSNFTFLGSNVFSFQNRVERRFFIRSFYFESKKEARNVLFFDGVASERKGI